MLEKEFEYFLAHKEELAKKYPGKYVVIKDQKVIGTYDDILEAVEETEKKYELGTFLVQLCSTDKAAYTATFHSRVAFA